MIGSMQSRGRQVFRGKATTCARHLVGRVRSVANTTVSPTEVIDPTDQAKLDALFRRFQMADTDGNGQIDRDELRHVLESTDGGDAVMFTDHWLPEAELDRVMEVYDKDKNGVIDLEEFKQIVYDGLLLDGKLSEYEEAFKGIDSSGNGTIGATELAELFSSLGQALSYEKLVDVMQTYDKDESGQIDFNEFLLMFRDQLLDLKAVNAYMANQSTDSVASGALVTVPEGTIPLIFSNQEFDELLAQSKATGRLLVVFNALTWCRPCKGMQRPAQKMAETYKDSTTWLKLFGNSNHQTKMMFKERFKIRSTPCFLVFKGDEIVYSQTGTNKEKLEAGLREAITADPALAAAMPQDWVYPPPPAA